MRFCAVILTSQAEEDVLIGLLFRVKDRHSGFGVFLEAVLWSDFEMQVDFKQSLTVIYTGSQAGSRRFRFGCIVFDAFPILLFIAGAPFPENAAHGGGRV